MAELSRYNEVPAEELALVELGPVTMMRLGDVIPAFDDESEEMDEQIVVCGATHRLGYVCDEPYWMGPHTWHMGDGGIHQWCACGENHHYNAECDATRALGASPEWAAWLKQERPSSLPEGEK
jgi:hypothetical protein